MAKSKEVSEQRIWLLRDHTHELGSSQLKFHGQRHYSLPSELAEELIAKGVAAEHEPQEVQTPAAVAEVKAPAADGEDLTVA